MLAYFQAGAFQHGQHQLVGGSWIGSGFEDHQLAGSKIFRGLLAGGHDEAHVRILGFAQRGGDGDVDGIELADRGEVRGGVKFSGFYQRPEHIGRNILDIGFAAAQLGRLWIPARRFR